jgi:hypothetical protein
MIRYASAAYMAGAVACLLLAACSSTSPIGTPLIASGEASGNASPTGSLSPPAPSPSEPKQVFLGSDFFMVTPKDWHFVPPEANFDPFNAAFQGPGVAEMNVHSVATGKTLAEAVAIINASLKEQTGKDPEQIENITMAGEPATLLTHHYSVNGQLIHHLDVVAVHGGRAFELAYANAAGDEEHDRALVVEVVSSFGYT